jgi:hypothetical protein
VSPWVKLSDGFDMDHRIDAVSLEAAGLFTRALSYTAGRLSDGFVDDRWLRRRIGSKKKRERILAELVEERLFLREGDGYVIVPVREGDVDRLVHVFTRAEVQEYRAKEAEKKRKQRRGGHALPDESSGHVPEGQPGGHPGASLDGRWLQDGSATGNTNGGAVSNRRDLSAHEALGCALPDWPDERRSFDAEGA